MPTPSFAGLPQDRSLARSGAGTCQVRGAYLPRRGATGSGGRANRASGLVLNLCAVDTGTVIAIVVPNLVAATAIVIGWRQQVRALEAERKLSDLSNVRALLDDAVVALHRAASPLDAARPNVVQDGTRSLHDEEREKPYDALSQAGRELDVLLDERLSIRFGRDHHLTGAFRGVDAALLAIYRKLALVKLEPHAGTEGARQQLRSFLEEVRRETVELRETFDAERRSLIDAA